MRICRALKTNFLTQGFGENLVPFYKELGMLGHNGWDWLVRCVIRTLNPRCEPIYFDVWDCYGKVIKISDEPNEGRGVSIITEDKDGIFKHRYWHFYKPAPGLEAGQIISPGTFLGWSGNSGRYTTGPHLHRDLKPMGQDTYGNYYKLHPNNGYFGAVNIKPYFKNIFIKDLRENLETQISLLMRLIRLYQLLINILKGRWRP